MAEPVASDEELKAPPKSSEFRRVVRVFFGRKIAVIGMVIIILMILAAIFAPLLATHDPDTPYLLENLSPPSAQHLLGPIFWGGIHSAALFTALGLLY